MNTFKQYNIQLLCGLLFITLVGCNKYLDVSPDMRAELNTPEKVGELLATAYPQANYIPFTESMSDNVADKGAGSVDMVNSAPFQFKDITDIMQDSPVYYWNASYKSIAAANHALEAIAKAGDAKAYSRYKGEALIARAYAHFMLVILFSQPYEEHSAATLPGIPYVTEVEKVVIKKYERKTVAYVYQQIEKDITEGLPLIDDGAYISPKYHFTTAAAHAFASRFYLFKKDYQKTLAHANAVFTSGSIRSNLRQVNSTAYRSYQYNELQAQYTKSDNSANILLVEVPTAWGRSFASYRYGFSTAVLNELIQSQNITQGSWAYNIYGNELVYNIPKFREHFVRQTLNAETGIPYNMVPLFSAEEVLFNRAEANAMLGNEEAAINDLNDFSSTRIIYTDMIPIYVPEIHDIDRDKLVAFYKTADIQQALVRCILDFKRVNFLFEGQRWFDIIRHKLPVEHVTSTNKKMVLGPNDPMRVFQIPEEAQSSGIQLNPR
jgi:starch-binding outer membrane protein, SusD/RagB family